MDTWLKTADAAELAGVGTSTIKRWADEGRLRCMRTPGGHRRYRREDLDAILAEDRASDAAAQWLSRMLTGPAELLEAELLVAHTRHGAWWPVAEELGRAAELLGERWANGQLTVIDEHRVTERLHRTLALFSERILTPSDRTAALLAAPGDPHTLGLSLVELCLKEAGFTSIWLGARTPLEDVLEFLSETPVDLLAVSASSLSANPSELGAFARRLQATCREEETLLVLGGAGRWPHVPGAERFETLTAFGHFLRGLNG